MIEEIKKTLDPGSEEACLLDQLDVAKLPVHVAVIMDGNGRWAQQRGLGRKEGHQEGAVSARKICENARRIGIKYITLFAFSSENWKRPLLEVNALMDLLYQNLLDNRSLLVDNEIRFNIIGDIDKMPGKLKKKLMETIALSAHFNKMEINLALNYGGRMEIVSAIRRIISEGIPASRVDEKLISQYLYTVGRPDPDLLIRTSGELRISNFLLYQLAYSEFYFSDVLWPDFRLKDFLQAILAYQNRQRRFGKI